METYRKVAIYCRVSTEEQKERGSIQTQIQEIENYCSREALIIGYRYIDDGVSGTITFENRPEGKKLLDDAKEGLFDTLIIWKIDRIARECRISLNLEDTLTKLDIKLISITENFDFSTSEGMLLFSMQSAFAQHERDKIRERSIAGTNRVVKDGKWAGGIIPYGYKKDENGYPVVNHEKILNCKYSEAEIIDKIYKWVGEDGLSMVKVAEKLNNLGIPTHYAKDKRDFYKPIQNFKSSELEQIDLSNRRRGKTSNRWQPARISNMLRNTMYKGCHEYGKRSKTQRPTIKRKVPVIVSEELWEKTCTNLKNNHKWAKRNSIREYLLRGLIRCSCCGRTFIGSCYKDKVTTYYRCNGKLTSTEVSTGKKCPSKNIKGEWIENFVWEELKFWILNQEQLELLLEAKLEEYDKGKGNYFSEHAIIRDKIINKDREREDIISLYRKQIINMSDVEKQLEEIDKEKAALEAMLEDLKSKMITFDSTEKAIEEIKNDLDKYKDELSNGELSFNEKRKIVEIFIKEINVQLTKDNKPSVFIDTIPLRKTSKPNTLSRKFLQSINLRVNNKQVDNIQQLQEDTMNIVYRFQIPSREIGSIVKHTHTHACSIYTQLIH